MAIYLLASTGRLDRELSVQLNTPAVGASGAIFGLFGLVFVSTFVHKPALARQARAMTSQIGILIVINLVIGFAPGTNIDYMAHIGGLIVGAWLGFVIPPRGAATSGCLSGANGRRLNTGASSPAECLRSIAAGGVLLLGVVLVRRAAADAVLVARRVTNSSKA